MTGWVLRAAAPYGEAPVDLRLADGVIAEIGPPGSLSGGRLLDADRG